VPRRDRLWSPEELGAISRPLTERIRMAGPRESFGERNFGGAELGDLRRSRRLPELVNQMQRHPGGTLPQKLPRREDLEAFYRLCEAEDVTHAAVLQPHRQKTLQFLQTVDHWVLAIHDATELDYTSHASLEGDLGQIGNGYHRGYIVQNTLVVDPTRGAVVGLANQILHKRPQVPKGETQAQCRKRESRESLLWIRGTQDLPHRREIVDVCDRGADTFEHLEHETASGRTFVIRSSSSRSIQIGHQDGARALLHDYARTVPALTTCERAVPQKVIEKKPKRSGRKQRTIRTRRLAQLNVGAAPVLLRAPASKNGEHGDQPLPLWVVRVWEHSPPAGEEGLEWLLLTNHPVQTGDQALLVKSWYEWRWTVEEFHKGLKTGCGIESLQFQYVERLEPAIGILSVLALTLLALRDSGRHPEVRHRLANDFIDEEYIEVLALWRHHCYRPDWTVYDFNLALGRLGGHQGRKHDPPPGWLVLWRGWEKLQLMIDGARVAKLRQQLEQNKSPQRCA
jgi:hypothetical protein